MISQTQEFGKAPFRRSSHILRNTQEKPSVSRVQMSVAIDTGAVRIH